MFTSTVALAAIIGENSSALLGLLVGLIISICWITSSVAVLYLFESRSLKLFLIDSGFFIVFFAIAGMILGIWN